MLINDNNLAAAQSIYKENDISIKILKDKRDIYYATLKQDIISHYNSIINKSNALLKSTDKPESIFSEFKNLNQRARKDELILDSLENQLRLLSLEKARISDSWDLITKPTLIPYPIGATKKGENANKCNWCNTCWLSCCNWQG